MQRTLLIAIGIVALVVLLGPFLGNLTSTTQGSGFSGGGPQSAPTHDAAPVSQNGFNDGLTIARDSSGRFHTDAQVNGQTVQLLIDTGADAVALTEADAQSVGITPDPASFRPIITTASGTGYGARVRIDRLEIAGHSVSDVDAVVVRGLGASLLGQSVLRRLGPVTMAGDHMVIGN